MGRVECERFRLSNEIPPERVICECCWLLANVYCHWLRLMFERKCYIDGVRNPQFENLNRCFYFPFSFANLNKFLFLFFFSSFFVCCGVRLWCFVWCSVFCVFECVLCSRHSNDEHPDSMMLCDRKTKSSVLLLCRAQTELDGSTDKAWHSTLVC